MHQAAHCLADLSFEEIDAIPWQPNTLRSKIEASIERLIAALDGFDGDVDLELTGDDEPQPDEECPFGMLTSTSHARIGLSDDDEDDEYGGRPEWDGEPAGERKAA